MLKDYKDFVKDLGARESGNRYGIKNEYGYLGRFQFGNLRLIDFGMMRRVPTDPARPNLRLYTWVPPFSEEEFLKNHALQDALFDAHVGNLRLQIAKRYDKLLSHNFLGVKLTMSGAIACSHLLGMGGLKQFVTGVDTADALGTKASDYIKKFSDYVIPLSLPSIPEQVDLKRYVGQTV